MLYHMPERCWELILGVLTTQKNADFETGQVFANTRVEIARQDINASNQHEVHRKLSQRGYMLMVSQQSWEKFKMIQTSKLKDTSLLPRGRRPSPGRLGLPALWWDNPPSGMVLALT